jgi:2-methylcitrate dehydratase PrpD
MRSVVTSVPEGPRTARVWADGNRAPLSEAVTANAVAVHAHFHDDSDHASWSHPGSLIVPVAGSVGEAEASPLETVLRAIVAGYATLEWLGADEVVARALIGRGIRTSPTLGTVGAAATAAVGLGLDVPQATNAVAIATSITGGVLEPVRCGSDEWRVQNAQAARGGLLAAQLAGQGVLGAPDGLEGPKGLLRALAGLDETPPRWREDPRHDAILDAMAKPFATLGDNMPPSLTAKLIHDAGIDLGQIRSITVRMWRPYTEYPGTNFKGPYERPVQTQASTAFAVAAMLAYGELEYDVALARRQDPNILRLVERTTIEPHDGTHLEATVAVEFADGSRVERRSDESPRNLVFQDPPTATGGLESRLSRCGFPAGTGEAIARTVFDAAAGQTGLTMSELLDRLGTA